MLETAPLTMWARRVTLRAASPTGFVTPSDAVEHVSAGDDVYDTLVFVQVELAGLRLEPLEEPLVHGQGPAPVEERHLGVER